MEVARCKQSADNVDRGRLGRKTKHGGGVAVIHSDKLCAKTIKFSIKPTTFLDSRFKFLFLPTELCCCNDIQARIGKRE